MATVSTMILRSMRMIGEKTRGATLTSNESTETLDEFNTFLESLATENLLAYTVAEDTHALTASTASYTIGPGATINTTRPTKLIDPCFVRNSDGVDSSLKIINLDNYGLLTDKSSDTTVPTAIYYDAGYSATSTATLTLYPPPSTGLTLHIHSRKQISTVSTQSVNLSLPPGYRLFLESNFAIHLAAGYTNVSAEVAKIAKESRAHIMAMNAPDMVMRLERGARIGAAGLNSINIDSEYVQ